MIFPLLPAFVAVMGASPAFLGLIEGVADAISSLLKLLSGYITDRSAKKKPFVLAGYSIATAVRPLMALAVAPWQVLAIRMTDRIGKGIRSTPRDVLIAGAVSKEEAGRAFGFHHAMDHAGSVVGPLVATLLLGLGWSVRNVFAAALIPGLLALVAVISVREVKQEVVATKSVATHEPLPRALKSYFVILLVFALGNSSDAFLLLRAKEIGVEVKWLPLLWALFHVSKVASNYVGGGLADKVSRSKLVIVGWAVYAATYLAFGVANQVWQVWALFVIYGLYYGLTEPAEKALVKELCTPATLGRAYGLYNFTLGISAIAAGLLTGWLWKTGGGGLALGVGAAVAALASTAMMVWRRVAAYQV